MAKQCPKCHVVKALIHFSPQKTGKFGRTSHCKECKKQEAQIYREKHPNRIRKTVARSLEKHREYRRQKCREWRAKNPFTAKSSCSKWYRKASNRIIVCLQSRLRETAKVNVKRNELWEILGYTCNTFKYHIESQFTEGMSWKNHGEWEIDHIIPISFFTYNSPDDVEFKMCWRLENIQLLWKHEHRCKGAKVLVA